MSIIQERILENYHIPLSIEQTEIILNQMKTSVCQIHPGKFCARGTGFFCRIPYPDENNLLTVLITNNHVINEECIEKEKEIVVSLCKDKKKKEEIKKINISKNKKNFSNKDYDITIIEIKRGDEKIEHFLELHPNLMEDNCENTFNAKSIYAIGYPKSEQVKVSYGILKNKLEDKEYDFNHLCSTELGSSGSPILFSENNKVIGIHKKAASSHQNYNVGAFLKLAIIGLYNKYNKKEIPKNNNIQINQKNEILKNNNIQINQKKEILKNNNIQINQKKEIPKNNNFQKNQKKEIPKINNFQNDKSSNKKEKNENNIQKMLGIFDPSKNDKNKKNAYQKSDKENNYKKKDKEIKNNMLMDENPKKKNPFKVSNFKNDKSPISKNKENNDKKEENKVSKNYKNEFGKDKNNENSDIKKNQNDNKKIIK